MLGGIGGRRRRGRQRMRWLDGITDSMDANSIKSQKVFRVIIVFIFPQIIVNDNTAGKLCSILK